MADKFTAAEMADAIKKGKGILTAAATVLGCARQTVAVYIERYPTVKVAYEEAKESTIDFVESRLLKNIDNGDTTAMIFYLKTQGKRRGYVERQEVTGKDGGPIEHDYRGELLRKLTDLAGKPGRTVFSETGSESTTGGASADPELVGADE